MATTAGRRPNPSFRYRNDRRPPSPTASRSPLSQRERPVLPKDSSPLPVGEGRAKRRVRVQSGPLTVFIKSSTHPRMIITSVALMRAKARIPFLSPNSLHALRVMIEVIACPPTSMVT